MTDRVHESAAVAVADIGDGASIAVGTFGVCEISDALIEAITEADTTDLEVFSNN